MTRTVRQLIEKALSLINVISIGQTISTEDINLGLEAFEEIINEFNLKGLYIPYETTDTTTLVSGQESYTIGQSGSPDINTVRPIKITSAFTREGNNDYLLEIISIESYNRIFNKSIEGRPSYLYYNPTVLNGEIKLQPIPDSSYTLSLTSYKNFTSPTDLTDVLTTDLLIPSEYFNFLKFVLAEELMTHYDIEKVSIAARAEKARRDIRKINLARQITPVPLNEIVSTGNRYRRYRNYRYPF
jgi:hypothetical protein